MLHRPVLFPNLQLRQDKENVCSISVSLLPRKGFQWEDNEEQKKKQQKKTVQPSAKEPSGVFDSQGHFHVLHSTKSTHTHTPWNLYLSPPSPIVLFSVTESFPQFHLSCLWNREPCKPPQRQGLELPGVKAGVSSSALLFPTFWWFWSHCLEKIGFLSS